MNWNKGSDIYNITIVLLFNERSFFFLGKLWLMYATERYSLYIKGKYRTFLVSNFNQIRKRSEFSVHLFCKYKFKKNERVRENSEIDTFLTKPWKVNWRIGFMA